VQKSRSKTMGYSLRCKRAAPKKPKIAPTN
jgi:hypothetical protein